MARAICRRHLPIPARRARIALLSFSALARSSLEIASLCAAANFQPPQTRAPRDNYHRSIRPMLPVESQPDSAAYVRGRRRSKWTPPWCVSPDKVRDPIFLSSGRASDADASYTVYALSRSSSPASQRRKNFFSFRLLCSRVIRARAPTVWGWTGGSIEACG